MNASPVLRTLILALLLTLFVSALSQPFSVVFSNSDVNARFDVVAVDSARNVFVAGVDGGDFFAQKLDPAGNEIWTSTIISGAATGVDSIGIDVAGNPHIAGRTNGRTIFFASFDGVTGSVRYSRSTGFVAAAVSVVKLAAAKSGNSSLIFAGATIDTVNAGRDVLVLRINPANGATIWQRQMDGGLQQDDILSTLATNAAGALFISARFRKLAGATGTVMRLAGSDGSTTFERDLGIGGTVQGLVAINGTTNLGFLGFGALSETSVVGILNANTGTIVRQVVVPASPVAAFSGQTGDMIVTLSKATGFVLRVNGTNGIFSSIATSEQIQRALCADLSEQIFHSPTVIGSSVPFIRQPAFAQLSLTFGPRSAVVDNENNIVMVGAEGALSRVVKLSQGLAVTPDFFAAPFGSSLTVPGPGVLANDAAFGATLSVSQAPTKGALSLSQNGGFIYTPGGNFTGTDNFTYTLVRNGLQLNARVDIARVSLASFHMSPANIVGGSPGTGVLTMASTPTVGIEAVIAESSSAVISPTSVVISTLGDTTSFPISTLPVSADFSVPITATAAGVSKSTTLLVKVGGLKAIVLSGSTSVVAGESRTVRIELTGPAPANTTVALSGSGPEASFPTTLTIFSGATFRAFTMGVAQRTSPASFTLTAKLADVTKTLTISIQPMPKLATFTGPDTVVGGLPASMFATLDKTTPYFLPVSLVLTSNPGSIATLPSSSIFSPGTISRTFGVATIATNTNRVFTVQASVGGVTRSRNVLVIRNPLDSVVATPTTVTGGQPLSITVNLSNLAPAGGITVQLASDKPILAVPPSVLVAGGSWAATVAATTLPVVFGSRATVTATLAGVTRTVTVNIGP